MRRRGRQQGQALVEFSLVFGVLLLLTLGILDLSRGFFARSNMEHGSREAARYGSTNATDGGGIENAVIQNASAGGFTVTPSQIAVTYWDPSNSNQVGSWTPGPGYVGTNPCPLGAGACDQPVAGEYVRVNVNYPWAAATTVIRDVIPSNLIIRVQAQGRIEE